jgi:hypothetical protein
MALNMQNSIDSEHSNQENKPRHNNKMKKNTTRLHSENKEEPSNQVTAIVIPILTYKNKHIHNPNSRSKKNRGCLVQLYEAIITI